MIVLLDNQDSFVYNLVDALAEYESVLFRNTVNADSILALDPELIVLSPGRHVPVARYHSLGTTEMLAGMHALARTGDIVMAAATDDGMSIGLQFHPESILTPAGPTMLRRCVEKLKKGN